MLFRGHPEIWLRLKPFFFSFVVHFSPMEILTVVLLAIGLSFDSFAVSVCSGLNLPHIRFFQATKIAIFLAVFQAAMPLIGWLVGNSVKPIIEPVDHWLAFGLLGLIGGKMIIESLLGGEQREIKNPLQIKVILMLSVATSIDALAVGFTFATLLDKILIAVFIIGAVTFIAAMLGILLGKKTGPKISRFAEIAGGVILVAIGTKILVEHVFFS